MLKMRSYVGYCLLFKRGWGLVGVWVVGVYAGLLTTGISSGGGDGGSASFACITIYALTRQIVGLLKYLYWKYMIRCVRSICASSELVSLLIMGNPNVINDGLYEF